MEIDSIMDTEKKEAVGLDGVLGDYFDESARAIETVKENLDTVKEMVNEIFES
jgi:hypothetical protein